MDRTCLGGLVVVGVILALAGACAPEGEVEPGALGPCGVKVDDTELYNRVFAKISARQADGRALYQTWPLFPGEPALKRLGLAVHGRWTTVYADPEHAFPFLENAIRSGHEQPLELPPGSILVKENYRSSPGATVISPDQSTLEVLTVMAKPEPGEPVPEGSLYPFPCVTDTLDPYNGDPQTGCLGGRWFYAFYKVEPDDPTTCQTDDFGKFLNTHVNTSLGSFCVHCHSPAFQTDYLRILDQDLNPPRVPPGPPPEVPGVPPPSCDLDLSPQPPDDVPVDPLAVWAGDPAAAKSMFDCFSWRTFVALSWPADPDHPGQPDPDRSILDVHGPGDGPVVWQTYFPVYGLFQPGDVGWQPPPFDRPVVPDAPHCDAAPGEMIVTLASKARDIPNETGQAFAGTFGNLRDRNKNLVWYEVLVNEVEYDYIVGNGLASTPRLTPSGPRNADGNGLFAVDFPFNGETRSNSIEVKSAWKQLCTGPGCQPVDDPSRFYTTMARVYDAGTKECSPEPIQMGLIGLHLAIRTFWAPQWVWATFEHETNAPTAGTGEVSQDIYSFHNPGLPEPTGCFLDPFLISPAGCPNVVLNRFPGSQNVILPSGAHLPPPDQPDQITRLVPIDPQAAALNAQFRPKLRGTPFEHYLLVDAQWPLNGQAGTREDPKPVMKACENNGLGENCFQLVPQFLRNTVVESYMTTYDTVGGQPTQVSNRSCLNCHVATGNNGSYVWLDAVANRVPVSGGS